MMDQMHAHVFKGFSDRSDFYAPRYGSISEVSSERSVSFARPREEGALSIGASLCFVGCPLFEADYDKISSTLAYLGRMDDPIVFRYPVVYEDGTKTEWMYVRFNLHRAGLCCAPSDGRRTRCLQAVRQRRGR